jgi:LacI family transcriptional regulator
MVSDTYRVRTRTMKNTRATVKEIARLAGVSIGTVDRVLHNRGEVSADTKAKIHAIVGALGYEPNILARQLAHNRTYTFRAVLPRADQDSGYWSLCLGGIRRAEHALAPYGTKVRIDEFDRYDRAGYRTLLKDVVADPCDGLLIAPVLPEDLVQALARLSGAASKATTQVPYVFFDCDAEGTAPVAAIGQDALRGGQLAGRLMSLVAKGTGPFVALSAHAGDRHIRLRIEGFEGYLRQASSAKGARKVIVTECPELVTPKDCEKALGKIFRSTPDVAGVLVANASGHIVGEWLAKRDAKKSCAVVSWDLVPANAQALRDDKIDCVVSQRPADQAREGLERLYSAVVRGHRDSSPASIPLEAYFKENIPERETA